MSEYANELLPGLEGADAIPVPPALPVPVGNGTTLCSHCQKPASWHHYRARGTYISVRCEPKGSETRGFEKEEVLATAALTGIDVYRLQLISKGRIEGSWKRKEG